jgi:hypothetical protein
MLQGAGQPGASRHGSISSTPSGDMAASRPTSPPASQTQLTLSRRASLVTGVSEARRLNRSGSVNSTASSYEVGPVAAAMSRNAQMNARVQSYVGGPTEHELADHEGDGEDDGKQGKMRQLTKKLTSLGLGRRKS